jgi:hypothetical protein
VSVTTEPSTVFHFQNRSGVERDISQPLVLHAAVTKHAPLNQDKAKRGIMESVIMMRPPSDRGNQLATRQRTLTIVGLDHWYETDETAVLEWRGIHH